MEQNKIWEHFQNEDLEAFKGNAPRLNFILGKIERLTRAPGMNVLDIGVGNGYFEMLAVQKKYSVAALDPDNKAIEKLKRMGIDAKQGSLSAVPFADNTFDFVVASEVLEHLKSEEMPKAIQEINRVLKKGGYFVGTVPFNELLKDKMTVCPHCGELFHRWGHQQSFSKEKMAKDLSAYLEIIETKIRSFVSFSGRSFRGKIKSAFKWVLGAMGEQVADPHLYFCAKKK